ncbi:MAG: type III secretion system export apparatus subunit SctS [Oligoflexales bacterium]|nr:type III secretion system export apparatus subunit SctS [Oligoflexales bacterium]
MTESYIIQYTIKTLIIVLTLSLPPIIAAAIVSTFISFLQAITQIQDQTLTFVAKLVATFGTIYLTSWWLGGELYNFSLQIFDQIMKN